MQNILNQLKTSADKKAKSQGFDPTDMRGNKGSDGRANKTPNLEIQRLGWILGLPIASDMVPDHHPVVVAVGGGKGGVGKSFITANLSCALAKQGHSVLVIDADFGGPNLHTYFGLQEIRNSLNDYLRGKVTDLREVIYGTDVPGLDLICASRDEIIGESDNFYCSAFFRLWKDLLNVGIPRNENRKPHFIIVDLGAGAHKQTIDFFSMANIGLITVVPEPTSIENAYLFMRTFLVQTISNTCHNTGLHDFNVSIKAFLSQNQTVGKSNYLDKLKCLYQKFPGPMSPVLTAIQSRYLGFVVNETRSQADIDIGRAMEFVGRSYFGLNCGYLGFLNYDEAAWKSLRNKRLLTADFPHSLLAKGMRDLATKLLRQSGFSC